MNPQAPDMATMPPELPEGLLDPRAVWTLGEVLGLFFGVVCGLLLLGALGWFLWRKRRGTGAIRAVVEPRREALERLRTLEGTQGGMEQSPFTRAVTDAVKGFLDREYGLDLKGKTTQEYLAGMLGQRSGRGLPASYGQRLKEFFEWCDGFKFQPEAVAQASRSEVLREAESLIREAPLPHREELAQGVES